jgi:hypothetical protein
MIMETEDKKQQMMNDEYGRNFGGCVWTVGVVAAIIVSLILILLT